MFQNLILRMAIRFLGNSGALDRLLRPLLEDLLVTSEKGIEVLLDVIEIVDDIVLDNLELLAPETAKRFQEVLVGIFAKIHERVDN